jgi:hypothetical protein
MWRPLGRLAQVVQHNFVGRNLFQIPLGKRWSAPLHVCHVVRFLVRAVTKNPALCSSPPALGLERILGTPPWSEQRRADRGQGQGKSDSTGGQQERRAVSPGGRRRAQDQIKAERDRDRERRLGANGGKRKGQISGDEAEDASRGTPDDKAGRFLPAFLSQDGLFPGANRGANKLETATSPKTGVATSP